MFTKCPFSRGLNCPYFIPFPSPSLSLPPPIFPLVPGDPPPPSLFPVLPLRVFALIRTLRCYPLPAKEQLTTNSIHPAALLCQLNPLPTCPFHFHSMNTFSHSLTLSASSSSATVLYLFRSRVLLVLARWPKIPSVSDRFE